MITVDRREEQEAISHHDVSIPTLIHVPCVIDTLDAGDFAFLSINNEPVGIERCHIGNFVEKLRSGELEEQIRRCDDSYEIVYLLTEGVYDQVSGLLAIHKQSDKGYFRTRVYPHTSFGYVTASLIRLEDMGIKLVHSPNFECSMMLVETIYHQQTKPEEERQLFKRIRPIKIPVKMSANKAVPKLLALCPRMPEKVAIRLLNTYSDIWTILNTEDSDLLQVDGMGKGLLQKLKDGVGK